MLSTDNTLTASRDLFPVEGGPKLNFSEIFNDTVLEFAISGAFALLMTAGMLRVLLESSL